MSPSLSEMRDSELLNKFKYESTQLAEKEAQEAAFRKSIQPSQMPEGQYRKYTSYGNDPVIHGSVVDASGKQLENTAIPQKPPEETYRKFTGSGDAPISVSAEGGNSEPLVRDIAAVPPPKPPDEDMEMIEKWVTELSPNLHKTLSQQPQYDEKKAGAAYMEQYKGVDIKTLTPENQAKIQNEKNAIEQKVVQDRDVAVKAMMPEYMRGVKEKRNAEGKSAKEMESGKSAAREKIRENELQKMSAVSQRDQKTDEDGKPIVHSKGMLDGFNLVIKSLEDENKELSKKYGLVSQPEAQSGAAPKQGMSESEYTKWAIENKMDRKTASEGWSLYKKTESTPKVKAVEKTGTIPSSPPEEFNRINNPAPPQPPMGEASSPSSVATENPVPARPPAGQPNLWADVRGLAKNAGNFYGSRAINAYTLDRLREEEKRLKDKK